MSRRRSGSAINLQRVPYNQLIFHRFSTLFLDSLYSLKTITTNENDFEEDLFLFKQIIDNPTEFHIAKLNISIIFYQYEPKLIDFIF